MCSRTEEILAKTIYAEARGESEEGQRWVGHVIKNRAQADRGYWGGRSVEAVCRHPWQFECWNGRGDIDVSGEPEAYHRALRIAREVLNSGEDPTRGCDHFNNPDKEGYPGWTQNCEWREKVGNHQFYKGK